MRGWDREYSRQKVRVLGCKLKKAGKGIACLGKVVNSVVRLSGCGGVRREEPKIRLEG